MDARIGCRLRLSAVVRLPLYDTSFATVTLFTIITMHHHSIQKLQQKIKKYLPSLLLVAIALFLGMLAGPAVISHPETSASVLDDIQNFLRRGFVSQQEQVQAPPFQPTNSYEEAIVSSVRAAAPAVVSVAVTKDVPVIEECLRSQQFFGQIFQFSVPCERGTERREVGGGSGFIISADGYVLTNKHVVDDADAEYTVLTNDGKKYPATVLGRHPSLDIAVLKISGSGFPTAKLGDSSGIQLGQTAIAIGNALGEFRNTVSVGIVSGLARSVAAQSSGGTVETIENVIQTDAAINPGNSGGPLLNSNGEVIGINTAMVSGAQSIGFAIPINAAKNSIASVISSGAIHAAYLGIQYSSDGRIVSVEDGSPAQRAGVTEGDILVAIDGQKIDAEHSPAYIISQKNPGDSVTIEILRDEQELSVQATLGERK
jgi:serine protease Do